MKIKHDQTYTKALLIDLQIFKWSSRKKQTKTDCLQIKFLKLVHYFISNA